ncbi:transcriptional regulator [Sphingomonas sp. Root710]|uniref:helix-turn-helix domain-containing protein n=1 Tax=Sphingomonas sp. Root710 TaxID=1736594 RepID=UPI0006FB77E9|nr:helix-turn-helix transcriptional regulator [Sphingomonas sp. Root710]KRB86526.1 transcriptional regulator [Sphingomonas sp. Root710]
MDVRKRLAANMKKLRKERGWSQETLADEAGLDRTYISGIERVVKNPTITVVERVAAALDCRMSDLLD